MKKLFANDWLLLHPYTQADETDFYYTKIANKVYETLMYSKLANAFPTDANMRYTSLCLTAWFEDVISQTNIWHTFTAECKKNYGYYLPFFELTEDNYVPEEINVQDVRYLLWHHVQWFHRADTVMNPENPDFETVAETIYKIFDTEYEQAPANDRLKKFLYAPMKDTDFSHYRDVLEWFHYKSYFNIESEGAYYMEAQKIQQDKNIQPGYKPAALYDVRVQLLLVGRGDPLSYTTMEWLSKLYADKPELHLAKNAFVEKGHYFLYIGEDEKDLQVKDIFGEDPNRELTIHKKSIDEKSLKGKKPGQTLLSCTLIRFGSDCYQFGMLVAQDYTPALHDQIAGQQKVEKEAKAYYLRLFHNFMEATGGKFFHYCFNKEEAKKFADEQIKVDKDKQPELPEIFDKGCVMIGSPETGVELQPYLLPCMKDADNKAYDEKVAKENAAAFLLNPQLVSYEAACLLEDLGLLPDATLQSPLDEAHNKAFFDKYKHFLTDYYFHRLRSKDFQNKEVLDYLKKE